MTTLYALNYDCPIPWPAYPAYPAPSSSMSRSKGKQRQREQPQQEEEANNKEEHFGQCECILNTPATLGNAYLHALYTCQRDDCARQFLHALTARDTPWSRNTEGESTTLQQLQDLLRDLDELDTKWHTTYSDLLSTWEEPKQPDAQEGKQPEDQALSGEASSSVSVHGIRSHHEVIQDDTVDQALQDQLAGTDPQDRLFKQAYSTWRVSLENARNSTNGTSLHHQTKGKSKKKDVPKTSREWLSNLEVLEIKLQILLSLEILARLPTPSSRLGPNRPTSSSRNSWFTDLRNSQVAHSSSDTGLMSRKRKKADPDSAQTASMQEHGGHGDMQDGSEVSISKKALEKLYKKIAIRLDRLTDNLAIHQAVSGLGFSLDDLVMNNSHGYGPSGGDDTAGGEQDGVQSFWSGTVEPEYASRLPSDIISGCHSKFFSASSSQSRSIDETQQEDSPYHHPTPNLKALAKSVAAAQAADLAKKIPASPTLAKLLKANDEKHVNRRRATDDEEADANWLMPPSATKAKSTYSVFSDKETQADESRRKLKRSQSLNAQLHQEVNTNLGGSRNIFKSREVSFGQKKSGSSISVAATSTMTSGVAATTLGGIRKTSAFMRTNSVPLLHASASVVSSLPPTTSVVSTHADTSKQKPEALSTNIDNGQTHKRKPASPKRLSTSMQREKSRTLVLATPAKLHKHGKSRLSVQSTVMQSEDGEEHTDSIDGAAAMHGAAHMQNLVEEEEEEESPDEMDIIAHKRTSNNLAETLVNETPRTERILAAETPGSREIWVGETPAR